MKPTNIHINMYEHGRGWQWSQSFTSPIGETEAAEYCTNFSGDGLFIWPGGHQILGTCQFYLPYSRSAAYSKIRRWIIREKSIRV